MNEGLPPDRSRVPTEGRHGAGARIDVASSAEIAALMSAEDEAAVLAVKGVTGAIGGFVDDLVERFRAGGRLIYVGAGTSGRLGVLDASECPPTFLVDPGRVVGVIAGGDGALRKSSESLEDDFDGAVCEFGRLGVDQRDAIVGITAGGTTPYPLGAIAHAHRAGALTALVTCGSVPEHVSADHVINPNTGAELIAGSTRLKAGTATKLVLNMISTTLMVRMGKVYEGLMVDLSATNDKLRDRGARIISMLTGLDRAAAFALLHTADGRVKPAIVMHRFGLSLDASEALLDRHAGSLRAALEHKS